ITNTQRAPNYPDTPTIAQGGFPDLTFDGLIGLFGPKDMAAAVRDRISADIKAVVSEPAVAESLTARGQVVRPRTSAEFAAAIEEQRAKLAAIAQRLGLKPAQ